MSSPPLLPEIAEGDSKGEVAALYAEIRETIGIPFVGLIYRTLAVEPGRLGSVWSRLGPLLGHPAMRAAAAALDPGLARAPAIEPAQGLAQLGFDAHLSVQAAATLAAYDRMNRLNLLGLSALLDPARPATSVVAPTVAAPGLEERWRPEALLPMPALAALDPAERDLLLRISEALLPTQRPVLVPSLLRHFARPGVLQALWKSLRPAVEGGFVPEAADRLRAQAASVPFPAGVAITPVADAETRQIARGFVAATSTMVVLGALIERALVSTTRG